MTQVSFYKTLAGNDVVLDFIRQMNASDRKVIGEDLKVVELRHPLGMPLCRPLGKGLWEVRCSLPSKQEVRLLYFFHKKSQRIIVVHGFFKTTRTTPKREIDLAEGRMGEY
jgi:phage-related protein